VNGYARLKTFTVLGMGAMAVVVEMHISTAAMPKTILVGLPDMSVNESVRRVEEMRLSARVAALVSRFTKRASHSAIPSDALSCVREFCTRRRVRANR